MPSASGGYVSTDHIVYPTSMYATSTSGHGVLNVVDLFGADPTGTDDSTAAIVAAIDALMGDVRAMRLSGEGPTSDRLASQRIIYFPNGTYNVSDSLVWSYPYFAANPDWTDPVCVVDNPPPDCGRNVTSEGSSYLRFRGESQDGVVIHLKYGSAGFDDPNNPKPIFKFSKALVAHPENPMNSVPGSNFIENLTIEVGENNPGAIGLLFAGANNNAIRNVTIRSLDGQAAYGIQVPIKVTQFLGYNITIDGFDRGISAEASVATQLTFESLTIQNYDDVGLYVSGSCVAARDFVASGTGPAVVVAENADDPNLGVVSLVNTDFTFTGTGTPPAAVEVETDTAHNRNAGGLHTRDQTIHGFTDAVHTRTDVVTGDIAGEYNSDAVVKLFANSDTSLGLVVKSTPMPSWPDQDTMWRSVNSSPYNAPNNGYYNNKTDGTEGNDATAAIQAALDDPNNTNIYFEPGTYLITAKITIPRHIQRINFMYAQIIVGSELIQDPTLSDDTFTVPEEHGVFVVQDGDATDPPLVFEDLFGWPAIGRYRFFSHNAPRTVILSDVHTQAGTMYRNLGYGGEAYFENASNLSGIISAGPDGYKGLPGFYWQGAGLSAWARHINAEHGNPDLVNDGSDVWILGFKKESPGTLIHCTGGGKTQIINGVVFNGGDNGPDIPDDLPILKNDHASVSATFGTSHQTRFSQDWTLAITEIQDIGGTTTTENQLATDLPERGSYSDYSDATAIMRRCMLYVGRQQT